MSQSSTKRRRERKHGKEDARLRKGVVALVALAALPVLFAFVAFAVDTGRINNTYVNLQNAADAAALAASQEITSAIHQAGQGEGDANIDANSIAVSAAREMAVMVAQANGVYVDPEQDVQFGKRLYNANDQSWPIVWDAQPYNVVRVEVRMDNPDRNAPDRQLGLLFGAFVGNPTISLTASASAFVEARDIVVVLDFSGSMNDDSEFSKIYALDQAAIEANMLDIFNALGPPNVGSLPWNPVYVYGNNTVVKQTFGLDSIPYPYPSGSWDGFINHCRYNGDVRNAGYQQKYGGKNFVDYLLDQKPSKSQTPDLWKTPQYPFHAIKNGCTLFCDFLTDLDFGDELGLVSYDSTSRVESFLNDGEAYVDITSNPITSNYADIDTIQRHKQAGHYASYTGMGYGVLEAKNLLAAEARYGARPTIILMTDGLANRYPSGWSMPGDFNWNDWTDFNDDGNADYTTADRSKQYAFWQVTEAISQGYTVHTMAVGTGADRTLMAAIAGASGGQYINVPGGSTVAEMESQLLDAFGEIASQVPPAKLVYDE